MGVRSMRCGRRRGETERECAMGETVCEHRSFGFFRAGDRTDFLGNNDEGTETIEAWEG